jgi:DnaJ-class molecular chaperone
MGTVNCQDCDWVGGVIYDSDGKCSACHGTGKSDILDQAFAAAFGEEAECQTCNGTGDCQTCGGTGKVEGDD